MPIAFDFGAVKTIRKMADGSLKAYARIAVANQPYKYLNRDGSSVIRQISPEELFKPESVNTLKVQVLTLDHPNESVTPSNYKKYSVGSTGDSFTTGFDGNFLGGIISIIDAQAIAAVESGKRQVSPGYNCKIINLDGNQWQTNRSYNHLALVDRARGGEACRLKDSTDPDEWIFDAAQIDDDLLNYWAADSPNLNDGAIDRLLQFGTLNPPPIELIMYTKITIDGIELEINPTYADAASKLNAKITQAALATDAAANKKDNSFALIAQIAAIKAKNEELQQQVDRQATEIADGVSAAVAELASARTEIAVFAQGRVDITAAKLCLDGNNITAYKAAIVSAIPGSKAGEDADRINAQYKMALDAFSMNFGLGQKFMVSSQERELATIQGGGIGLATRTMSAGESPGYQGATNTVNGVRPGGAMTGLPPMDQTWSK